MALTLPKFLVIADQRIARMYYALVLLTVIAVGLYFYFGELWVKQVDMAGHIHVSLWSPPTTNLALQGTWEAQASNDLCFSPQKFDYWWSQTYRYEGHKCLPICGLDVAGSVVGSPTVEEPFKCLPRGEMVIQENQHQAFLVTRLEERKEAADGRVTESQSYFVPTVEALSISFALSYRVEQASILPGGNSVSRPPESWHYGHSREGGSALIVVLKNDNTVYREYEPTKAITLTVLEILDLAGNRGLLNTDDIRLGKNAMPTLSSETGPIGRISGIAVNLLVDCYESGQLPGDKKGPLEKSWEESVCYVTIRRDSTWAEREEYEYDRGTGMGRFQKASGVRVKVITGGYWTVLDLNSIFVNLIALAVVLTYPRTFVLVFCTTFLGQLSEIYHRVIYERFHIGEQIGGMAARLLTYSSAYSEFLFKSGHGVTKEHLHKQLAEVTDFRRKVRQKGKRGGEKIVEVRDLERISAFTDFAWKTMNEPTWFDKYEDGYRFMNFLKKRYAIARYIMECFSTMLQCLTLGDGCGSQASSPSPNSTVSRDRLELDEYLSACSTAEPVGFFALLQIFSGTDEEISNRNRLERWFLPFYLTKYMKQRKDQTCDLAKQVCSPNRDVHANGTPDGYQATESDPIADSDNIARVVTVRSPITLDLSGPLREVAARSTFDDARAVCEQPNASQMKSATPQTQEIVITSIDSSQIVSRTPDSFSQPRRILAAPEDKTASDQIREIVARAEATCERIVEQRCNETLARFEAKLEQYSLPHTVASP